MRPVVEVCASPGQLVERASAVLADAIREAAADRSGCGIALSRLGETEVFRRLAALDDMPWDVVDVFQVDERVAPAGHPDRNLTLLERRLCELNAPPRLHPMSVGGDPDSDARRYAAELEAICGSPPVLDVVHLGLGADGHTASLLPGDPAADVGDAWVAATGPHGGYRRITMTFPTLDAARLVVFVVSGAGKAEAVRRVLAGDEALPAARLRAADVRFLLDSEAAATA